MDTADQILDAALLAFFPADFLSISAYSLVRKSINAGDWPQVQAVILNTGYQPAAEIRHSIRDLSSEKRLKCLENFILALRGGLNYARSGFDPDILNEFPAQRLIQVMDCPELVDWKTFWPANGGKFYGGGMVALKWDQVWRRISFLGVPVPPFQLGSRYDLEDVDRDEAESFGLIKPGERPPLIKIELDEADLKTRISKELTAIGG
jgi:hypothetical protein